MKAPKAFYPPLLAVYPALAIYGVNAAILPISDLWRPLAIMAGVSVVVWLLTSLIFRSIEKGAFATVIAIGLFWLYPILDPFVDQFAKPVLQYGFPVLGLVTIFFVVRKFSPTKFLNIVAAALIAMTVVQIGWHQYGNRLASGRQEIGKVTQKTGALPDVYYVILDGYGRADALKKSVNYDNSEFISKLEGLGFYVPTNSHSNYCQTALSLASSLNLDYVQTFFPTAPKAADDRQPLYQLIKDSRTLRTFAASGYQTVGISTGFPGIDLFKTNINLEGPQPMSLLEIAILQKTPFSDFGNTITTMFQARRRNLLAAFTNLDAQTIPTSKPKFVFAHVLAPHPPFVFGPNGEEKQGGPFGYWDGSDYMDQVGSSEKYRDGYVGQLQFLNKQVLKTVETLIQKSSRPPIIILQGDHGSKRHLVQNSEEKTDLQECFSNFVAVLGPKELEEKLYPTITPVNLIRTVVSETLGEKLEPLEDRSYFSPFSFPYQFSDVTKQLLPPDSAGPAEAKSSPSASSVPKG